MIKKVEKPKKITNKALKDLIKEKGKYRVEEMYFMGKLNIDSKQLDFLCNYGKKDK